MASLLAGRQAWALRRLDSVRAIGFEIEQSQPVRPIPVVEDQTPLPAAHAAELETAGYRLLEALSYAPHAGWVAARTDDVADSLGGMARLREIRGVEHVEPQMLTARASR